MSFAELGGPDVDRAHLVSFTEPVLSPDVRGEEARKLSTSTSVTLKDGSEAGGEEEARKLSMSASEGTGVKPKDDSEAGGLEAGGEEEAQKLSKITSERSDTIPKDDLEAGGEEEARKGDEMRQDSSSGMLGKEWLDSIDDKASAETEPETDVDGPDGLQPVSLAPSLSVGVPADGGSDGDDDAATSDAEELRYPSRLVSLCLPPGFHSWGNAAAYLASFLFLDAAFRAVKRRVGPGRPGREGGDESGNDDDDDGNFMRRLTRPGQDLSDGDAELLVGSRSRSACRCTFSIHLLCFASRASFAAVRRARHLPPDSSRSFRLRRDLLPLRDGVRLRSVSVLDYTSLFCALI